MKAQSPVRLLHGVFAAAAALGSSACLETFVADDVSFDQWCGDELCAWTVDRGEIEKVGSWHRSDSAVRLVGPEVQISQTQDFDDEDCIRFELITDIEPETRSTLQLDFNADGTVDLTQALPAQAWEPFEFIVRAPERYHGVRFVLHKAAPGHAVISQMAPSTVDTSQCSGAPLELAPQGEGAACASSEECAEGECAGGFCSVCAQSGDCSPGDPCSEDGQCASGHCTVDTCSECGSDADCGEGEACALRDYPESQRRECVEEDDLPRRALGQPCSRDAQCDGGYACDATHGDLEPRCGMACRGGDDLDCRGAAECVRLLTYFDDDWTAEDAFVCVEPDDCEDALFGECVDLDGAELDL